MSNNNSAARAATDQTVNKYRIISNGSKYRAQFRFLWLFWLDCYRVPRGSWEDETLGVPELYDSQDDALQAIERLKAESAQRGGNWKRIKAA